MAIVQRFGGAINLNVHLHALVLGGAFAMEGSVVAFHPIRRLTREDVAGLVALIARGVERLLERRGLAGGAESSGGAPDLWSEEAPVLAAVAATSVDGRVALGPRAGARVRRSGDPPEDTGTVVQRIAVGKRPRGIQLSQEGSHLYVALSGAPIAGPGVDESTLPPADRAADVIGLVDLASGSLVRKYESGQDPEAFAISNDGKRVFVSNEETAEMSVPSSMLLALTLNRNSPDRSPRILPVTK